MPFTVSILYLLVLSAADAVGFIVMAATIFEYFIRMLFMPFIIYSVPVIDSRPLF